MRKCDRCDFKIVDGSVGYCSFGVRSCNALNSDDPPVKTAENEWRIISAYEVIKKNKELLRNDL